MPDVSAEYIKSELALMAADPVYALKVLLPDWFPDRMPWVHRGILAILLRQTDFLLKYGEIDKIIKNFVWKEDPWDDTSDSRPMFKLRPDGHLDLEITPFTLIMLPRGFSKTTLLNGVNLYKTVFRLEKFPVYISESSTHAETQLNNVKNRLRDSPIIKTLFGELKPVQGAGLAWTDGFFQTTNGVSFLARGRGSQIRGQNIDAQRPTSILLDDVEDLESVKTDEQRAKTKTWAYRDVIPALPRRDPNASITALGTLLHTDSLLVTFSRDPRFNTVIFGAHDVDGDLLWEEQMNEEKLRIERQAAAKLGQLSGFYMEYYNKFRGAEDAKFRQDMFKYEPIPPNGWVADGKGGWRLSDEFMTALALDPAISDKPGADFAVIAVVAMSLKTGKHYVLEMWGKQGAAPREQVNMFFSLSKKWNVKHHGVEAIAFQAALVHLLREDMYRQGHYFEITEIKHSAKKAERILGILQPRYANGYIIHTHRFTRLETQLLDFPAGKDDDPDALSMAISLLDPYAAAAADDTIDLGADEYEPLEEWRQF